jgi:hypothetical protein
MFSLSITQKSAARETTKLHMNSNRIPSLYHNSEKERGRGKRIRERRRARWSKALREEVYQREAATKAKEVCMFKSTLLSLFCTKSFTTPKERMVDMPCSDSKRNVNGGEEER